ncbi:MAG: hypothetical protein QNJ68_02245 [Microcoleaceae cyanobacterium MO_207.B10]|nr:hypothetical protein [Microcoleaceae cyanobacterium MO_207.B10]
MFNSFSKQHTISSRAVNSTIGLALGIATIGISPANAALLDFSFTTDEGGIGSFTLDTSVPRYPIYDPNIWGLYPNSISNFNFSGSQPAASGGYLWAIKYNERLTFRINSAAYGGPSNVPGIPAQDDGPVSQLAFFFEFPETNEFVPSEPSDYVPTFDFVGFTGYIIFDPGASEGEYINSVTVSYSSQDIPEPTSSTAILSLGSLGAASLIKRLLNFKKRTSE